VTELSVVARGLTKVFHHYARPRDRLIEWMSLGAIQRHTAQVALEPLDLEVARGECVGVIGENGAGKSTLLKLVSRVLHPTGGTVETRGRVVSLLELGAAFHPELDGVANVFESARLLGYRDAEIRPRVDAILAFAELGEAARQPTRTYSSGMFVRLAFSLFAHLDPSVYIVDEALAVGDVFFQQKCFAFLESLKSRGVAVIVASHDMPSILRLCDRALLLERGRVIRAGDPLDVVNAYYERHRADGELAAVRDIAILDRLEGRRGTGDVRIREARFASPRGEPTRQRPKGGRVRLEIRASAHRDVDDLTFGFQMTDRMNTVVFGQTIYLKDRTVLSARAGESLEVSFEIDLAVEAGQYVFELVATDCRVDLPGVVYDRVPRALVLDVLDAPERASHGMVELPTSYAVQRRAEP